MGLLQEAGIRVPKFRVAESADQAYEIARSQGKKMLVISHINQ